jgi:thioredoxin 1
MGENEESTVEKDKELERIKQKKLKELLKGLEEKHQMDVKVVHVTDSNFEEIVNKNPLVLVDFWAEWCMPCRMIAPIVEDLAKEYAGKILIGKLNVDENPDTAERFHVFSIPTLLIIKNGAEVDRIVGFVPKSQIEACLKKHVK